MSLDILDSNRLRHYAEAVTLIARDAGACILEIYDRGYDVDTKTDGSPVTTADRHSHDLIIKGLEKLTPDVPVLSEESSMESIEHRRSWPHYWLIDPLDGTKEFINRHGEFTVNIALVHDQRPVIGVVYTPVQGLLHWAWSGGSAFRQSGEDRVQAIAAKEYQQGIPIVVASRSHGRGNLKLFLDSVEKSHGGYELTSMGSALKICIVAEGKADVYPRLGPTSEWDTAAAHCVLVVAGGKLVDCNGEPLLYNKESLLNPWFIACGRGHVDWTKHLLDIKADS